MFKQASVDRAITATQNKIRAKGYSIKTEKAYCRWLVRYIRWLDNHGAGNPEQKIEGFLTDLANTGSGVSPNTQRQAGIKLNIDTGANHEPY